MRARKQSSTANPILFLLTDNTDHVTGKTGLVPVVTLSKNGGAFGAALGAVAEVGNGWYSLAGNATDRNTVGELAVHAAVALADPYDGLVLITPLDPTDGVAFGMTALPAVAFGAANGLSSRIAHTGTAAAGSGSGITLAAGASAVDLYYLGCDISIVSGTGAQQTRQISNYIGSTKVVSVSRAWATNPDNTSVYVVVYNQTPKIDTALQVTAALRNLDSPNLGNGIAQAGGASTITLQNSSVATDDYYKGMTIKLYGGTGSSNTGQARVITGYVGSTFVATVDTPWAVQPDSTTLYAMVATRQASLNASLQPIAASVAGNVGGDVSGNLIGNVNGNVPNATLLPSGSLSMQSGTAQAGGASSITLQSTASAFDDVYIGDLIKIFSGQGGGQVRVITAYAGSTRVATVDRAWARIPDNTSIYTVLATTGPALNASLQPVAASVAGAVGGNVGGNVVGSVGSLAAQAQTDVESALTAQGYTTARAPFLDELGAANIPADVDTLLGRADVATSSRMATFVYTAPDNADIATILTDVAAILARVDVTLSTRLATLGYTAPDNADIATVLTDVGTLLTRIDVTLSTRLAALDYTAPANPDVSALAHLDVDVSTRLALTDYTAPDNDDVAAIKVVTDALPAFPSDPASDTHVDAEVGTAVSFLGGTIADTQNAITAEIDTRLAASDYVAPANPDVSALELLDVAVSTRLASGDYVAPDNTDIEAIRAWIASLTEPISIDLESAVGVDGSVKVRRGDSYTTGSKHGPLVWPGTATVWGAYVGIASVFTARDPAYRGRSFALEAIFEDMGEGVIQCRVELPSLATGSLSDQSIEEPWDFDVQATEDTLVDVTPIFGSFTILKDVTPPSVG